MVFEHLSDEKVEELFKKFKAKGMSDDEAFGEVYSIDCNMDEEANKMDTLTIEYRCKIDGLMYIRFDADQVPDEERIALYCHDDPTGRHDKTVSATDLAENYTEIKRYMEES